MQLWGTYRLFPVELVTISIMQRDRYFSFCNTVIESRCDTMLATFFTIRVFSYIRLFHDTITSSSTSCKNLNVSYFICPHLLPSCATVHSGTGNTRHTPAHRHPLPAGAKHWSSYISLVPTNDIFIKIILSYMKFNPACDTSTIVTHFVFSPCTNTENKEFPHINECRNV